MKLKFYFNKVDYANVVNVYLVGEDANGKHFIAKPMKIQFEPFEENGMKIDPTMEFSGFMAKDFFPALVNGLAESGYKYESSDAGELKATKEHLKDLQKLVFKNG